MHRRIIAALPLHFQISKIVGEFFLNRLSDSTAALLRQKLVDCEDKVTLSEVGDQSSGRRYKHHARHCHRFCLGESQKEDMYITKLGSHMA